MANDVVKSLLLSQNNSNHYFCSKRYGTAITANVLLALLVACTPVKNTPPPEPAIIIAPAPALSAEPLEETTRQQILFAQSALTKLGHELGEIDGLWGPRSAVATQAFESKLGITSAGGALSLLNLDELRKASNLDPNKIRSRKRKSKPVQKNGIEAKLKGELDNTGPQLVIIDQNYEVFVEPNPYSEVLLTLQAGTGVYVVNKTADWYQVESINRRIGYVSAN